LTTSATCGVGSVRSDARVGRDASASRRPRGSCGRWTSGTVTGGRRLCDPLRSRALRRHVTSVRVRRAGRLGPVVDSGPDWWKGSAGPEFLVGFHGGDPTIGAARRAFPAALQRAFSSGHPLHISSGLIPFLPRNAVKESLPMTPMPLTYRTRNESTHEDGST
jgi:hypothetical protein